MTAGLYSNPPFVLGVLQVDFDIATWDFVMHEEDPTSSEGPVSKAAPSILIHCVTSCLHFHATR